MSDQLTTRNIDGNYTVVFARLVFAPDADATCIGQAVDQLDETIERCEQVISKQLRIESGFKSMDSPYGYCFLFEGASHGASFASLLASSISVPLGIGIAEGFVRSVGLSRCGEEIKVEVGNAINLAARMAFAVDPGDGAVVCGCPMFATELRRESRVIANAFGEREEATVKRRRFKYHRLDYKQVLEVLSVEDRTLSIIPRAPAPIDTSLTGAFILLVDVAGFTRLPDDDARQDAIINMWRIIFDAREKIHLGPLPLYVAGGDGAAFVWSREETLNYPAHALFRLGTKINDLAIARNLRLHVALDYGPLKIVARDPAQLRIRAYGPPIYGAEEIGAQTDTRDLAIAAVCVGKFPDDIKSEIMLEGDLKTCATHQFYSLRSSPEQPSLRQILTMLGEDGPVSVISSRFLIQRASTETQQRRMIQDILNGLHRHELRSYRYIQLGGAKESLELCKRLFHTEIDSFEESAARQGLRDRLSFEHAVLCDENCPYLKFIIAHSPHVVAWKDNAGRECRAAVVAPTHEEFDGYSRWLLMSPAAAKTLDVWVSNVDTQCV